MGARTPAISVALSAPGWCVFWLASCLLGCVQLASAQDDEFEWFRCDSCSATFFKVNKVLRERLKGRTQSLPGWEFMEVLENICDNMFTKDEFGVKQHEGKKYLFGPGVIDHIPDKGFGQMGMGDYDKRLAGYCRMFIEDVGEEELQRLFDQDRRINGTALCFEECASSASGSGPRSTGRKRKKAPRSPRPPPRAKSRPRPRPKKPPRPSPQPGPPPQSKPLHEAPKQPLPTMQAPQADEPANADGLDSALRALPALSPLQLRWLGEAVLQELARRAERPTAAAAPGAGTQEL